MTSQPDRIGPYRVLARLGAGGMGEVFLAHDERLDRRVAIKRLLPEALGDRDAAGRLLIEARAAARLEHPNICGIYEVGEDTAGPFIVMPVVEGQTLAAKLASGPLPLCEALDIAAQVAEALAAAHGQGILHRDIKPANIMVNARGQARVMDFGLAKLTPLGDRSPSAVETADLVTKAGSTLGTAAYMSPEQALGGRLDARSDLFSLGIVVYEMVGGRRPFEGRSLAETLVATQTQEPPPLARLRPETPDELQRIVSKALRKPPEERYQSADDLAVDVRVLARTVRDGSASARPYTAGAAKSRMLTDPSMGASASTRTRGTIAAWAGGLVALALIAAAVIWSGRSSRTDAGASADITSLAVLPLANNSGNPDKEYVADGITDSLIRSLSQLPKLTVLSRNTAFKFKGQTADAQKIAAQLGVSAVLTGTITKADDQLVIDIELSDARNAGVILSRRYLQPSSRAPAMETDIAQDIARGLQVKLSGLDQHKLAKVTTENAAAYELYLKGRFFETRQTPDAIHEALDYYNQAIALDPTYAMANAAAGQAYLELGLYFEAPKDTMPAARRYATRAVALDGDLPDGRIVLGLVSLMYDWDWAAAAKATTTSDGMLPEAVAMFTCATHLLASTGHASESNDAIKRALTLDPLSTALNTELGCNSYYQHRYDDSIRGYRDAATLEPGNVVAYWGLGKALDHEKRYDEALGELAKAGANGATLPPIIVTEMGYAYAASGRTADARRILAQLQDMGKQIFVDPYLVATVYVAMNDTTSAFDSLQKAYDQRSGFMVALASEPKWDPIRSDPRFHELETRVGF